MSVLQLPFRFNFCTMIPSKSFPPPFPSVILCFACLCLLSPASVAASFDEELYETSLFNIGSDLACRFARCLKGQCVNTSSFPFYKCECNEGWASPFSRSWLPCILPNCSIDLTCDNSSASPAPPPTAPLIGAISDICSLPVCGNGVCVTNTTASNSTDDYECRCNTGYVNLGNQSDGYCIHKCSIGAGCSNVRLPFGGTTPPPPPPSLSSPVSSSSSNGNQGQMKEILNRLMSVTTLASVILWI